MTGKKTWIYIYTGSSGAKSILQREGVGRLRYLSCRILWLQNVVGNGGLKFWSISRHTNPADIGAKRPSAPRMKSLMAVLGSYNRATGNLEGNDDPGRVFVRRRSIKTLASALIHWWSYRLINWTKGHHHDESRCHTLGLRLLKHMPPILLQTLLRLQVQSCQLLLVVQISLVCHWSMMKVTCLSLVHFGAQKRCWLLLTAVVKEDLQLQRPKPKGTCTKKGCKWCVMSWLHVAVATLLQKWLPLRWPGQCPTYQIMKIHQTVIYCNTMDEVERVVEVGQQIAALAHGPLGPVTTSGRVHVDNVANALLQIQLNIWKQIPNGWCGTGMLRCVKWATLMSGWSCTMECLMMKNQKTLEPFANGPQ